MSEVFVVDSKESIVASEPAPNQLQGEPAWEVASLFPPQGQWTSREYLSLTRSTNRLVEFNRGRIEVLPMPTEAHQFIVRYLFLALHSFVAAKQLGEVVFAPIRVQTLPDKFREPDVALMLTENSGRRSNSFWTGADLVMEVVSDDPESRDRGLKDKRTEYAAAGIEEYWIVDPQQQQITVLRLATDQYEAQGVFGIGDKVPSSLLAGFSLSVADVFAAANGTT